MTTDQPSPLLSRLLSWTTDCFYALRLAGFKDEQISRIISTTLNDRLPPPRPYVDAPTRRIEEPPE